MNVINLCILFQHPIIIFHRAQCNFITNWKSCKSQLLLKWKSGIFPSRSHNCHRNSTHVPGFNQQEHLTCIRQKIESKNHSPDCSFYYLFLICLRKSSLLSSHEALTPALYLILALSPPRHIIKLRDFYCSLSCHTLRNIAHVNSVKDT